MHKEDGGKGGTDYVVVSRGRIRKLLYDPIPHHDDGPEETVAATNIHETCLDHLDGHGAYGEGEALVEEALFGNDGVVGGLRPHFVDVGPPQDLVIALGHGYSLVLAVLFKFLDK